MHKTVQLKVYFYKTIYSIHAFKVRGDILTFESSVITSEEYGVHLFKIN